MSVEIFTNNALTTLAVACGISDTTITVASASTFPTTGNFRIGIDQEIMLVTAVAGNVFTVTRAAEKTGGVQTAAAHAIGAAVQDLLTAASVVLATGNGTGLTSAAIIAALGFTPVAGPVVSSFNTRAGAVVLTSGDVTGALGFTPLAGPLTSAEVVSALGYVPVNTSAANTFTAPQSFVPSAGGPSAIQTQDVSGTFAASLANIDVTESIGYAGQFSGPGGIVTLCDGTYAINVVSGAARLGANCDYGKSAANTLTTPYLVSDPTPLGAGANGSLTMATTDTANGRIVYGWRAVNAPTSESGVVWTLPEADNGGLFGGDSYFSSDGAGNTSFQSLSGYLVSLSLANTNTPQTFTASTATTNAAETIITQLALCSTTTAAGFGVTEQYQGQVGTSTIKNMASFTATFTNATSAAFATKGVWSMTDHATTRPIITMGASGTAPLISFLAVPTPIAARTGDVGTGLVALGLFTSFVYSYSPGTPGNWAGTAPTTIGAALDRIVAWVLANVTTGAWVTTQALP